MLYDNQSKGIQRCIATKCKKYYYNCHLPIIANCYWLPQSTFNHMIPTDVNTQFIKYSNNSIKVNNDHSMLCVCNDQMESDCSINDLGYLYPGETLNIMKIKNQINILLK